jgi:hypothetical protein
MPGEARDAAVTRAEEYVLGSLRGDLKRQGTPEAVLYLRTCSRRGWSR